LNDAELTKLICSLLGERDGWAWGGDDPEFTYPDDSVAVFYGALGATPDRAVGVRTYGATESRIGNFFLSTRLIQLRLRGAQGRPDGADELAAEAFDALHGLSRVGGISDITRRSMAPAGTDYNRREERTENYQIILDNQEALDG
jgi:hypothetical protein